MIYWDDEQGIWVTIPYRLIINGEVVSVPLYRDHPDKRVVLEGVYSGNDGMIPLYDELPRCVCDGVGLLTPFGEESKFWPKGQGPARLRALFAFVLIIVYAL